MRSFIWNLGWVVSFADQSEKEQKAVKEREPEQGPLGEQRRAELAGVVIKCCRGSDYSKTPGENSGSKSLELAVLLLRVCCRGCDVV